MRLDARQVTVLFGWLDEMGEEGLADDMTCADERGSMSHCRLYLS
jgi:hypothetical protein